MRHNRIVFRALAVGVGLVFLTCSGCGKKEARKPVVLVEGKVLVRGKPAAGAVVVLVPPADEPGGSPVRPHGVAGPDGTFKLTTYDPGDGAPAGDYGVAVTWRGESRRSAIDPEDPGPAGDGRAKDALGGRYRNAKTSGLKATVGPGATGLKPFELK